MDHPQRYQKAQRLVGRCPVCKETPQMDYEPGCSLASCQCHDWSVPDEDFQELARIINETFYPDLAKVRRMKEITAKWKEKATTKA